MKSVINYLIVVILLYLVFFVTYISIAFDLEKRKRKREDEIMHDKAINKVIASDVNIEENITMSNEYRSKKMIKQKYNFYVFMMCLIAFIILVSIGFLTNGQSIRHEFLQYGYYAVPIIGLYVLSDAHDYLKSMKKR